MITESQAIEIFGALAQETRLKIVRALVKAGPHGLAAGRLADETGVSASNLSFHLRELSSAELITSRREHRSIIYICQYEQLHALQAFLLEKCCGGWPEVCTPITKPRQKK